MADINEFCTDCSMAVFELFTDRVVMVEDIVEIFA